MRLDLKLAKAGPKDSLESGCSGGYPEMDFGGLGRGFREAVLRGV